MPERLSRRAFIGVAAAIGGLTSFLGFDRSAQSQGHRSEIDSSQIELAGLKSTATCVAPSNPTLYDCCLGCLKLHKYRGGYKNNSFHVKGPPPVGDLGNDGTRYSFSAALINNVANNTLHIRDHIRMCEPINDQDAWPVPKKQSIVDQGVLQKNINMWIDVQSQLFQGILLIYQLCEPIFDGSDDIQARGNDVDEYYRLAYCGIEFIQLENKRWTPADQFSYDALPSIPVANSVPDSTITSSLQDLEWGFHRLVQAQMEIASFMPDHFNINAAAVCAGSGGVPPSGGIHGAIK
jgi:hypothetical protein